MWDHFFVMLNFGDHRALKANQSVCESIVCYHAGGGLQ
jgi:hypothetical protein